MVAVGSILVPGTREEQNVEKVNEGGRWLGCYSWPSGVFPLSALEAQAR